MGLLVSIDNGGTLTDICAFDGANIIHAKTLTTPHDLTECLMVGLKALSEKIDGAPELLELVASIDHLRYSTTQGTNAIAQRKGPRIGVLFSNRDQKEAVYQQAPELFDAFVGDRVSYVADGSEQKIIQEVRGLVAHGASRLVVCLQEEDATAGEADLKRKLYKAFPRHLLGAVPLLFSTDLVAGTGMIRRSWTSIINAFLHPSMEQFLHNAEEKLRDNRIRNPLLVFRNDGSSTRVSRTVAINTYSSGPRGGAEGAAVLAGHYGMEAVVSIDIGGTTTDLAHFDKAVVSESRSGSIEQAPVAFPMADVDSVAAGGGSILKAVNAELLVGPESVGSLPGPACFGRGGSEATITDVLLVAGLFDPNSFFGGKLKLDRDRAEKAVMENIANPMGVPLQGAVSAAINAYEGKIAQAITSATDDKSASALMAFGGAGPMSACGIAEKAGIDTVLVPRYAAVFSAFGIGFSPISHTHSFAVKDFKVATVQEAQASLLAKAARAMTSEGFDLEDCQLSWHAIIAEGDDVSEVLLDQVSENEQGTLELDVVRTIPTTELGSANTEKISPATSKENRGHMPLYRLEDLVPGNFGQGPCLVEEEFFTAWVRDGWQFTVTSNHDLLIQSQGE